MTFRWATVETEAPEFAARVVERFDSHTHKVLGTVRADGSPRLSGVEIKFALGDIWLGSMSHARKAADLLRDGRCALHSAPDAAEMPNGDAKIGGVAHQDDAGRLAELWGFEPPPDAEDDGSHLFRIELTDVSIARVEGDEMVIDVFTADGGLRQIRRR